MDNGIDIDSGYKRYNESLASKTLDWCCHRTTCFGEGGIPNLGMIDGLVRRELGTAKVWSGVIEELHVPGC